MMSSYINIDIFEIKEEILENFTMKEMKTEIQRREKLGIEEDDEMTCHRMCQDFDIDLSDYADEFWEDISEWDMIDELENRHYTVFKNGQSYEYLTKCNLSSILGLRPWATNEQILEELKYIL